MQAVLGRAWPEETETKPKPMVDVGGRPVHWHIMKHYAQFGPNEFVVVLGYKGEYVKRYFADCRALQGHIRVNLANGVVVNKSEVDGFTGFIDGTFL